MSRTKKIPISKLRAGMFVHEIDISWLQSPFLRHRRKIQNNSEIDMLRQSGVRIVTIDLDKGIDVAADEEKNEPEAAGCEETLEPESKVIESAAEPVAKETQKKPEKQLTISTSLKDELETARILQSKIQESVKKLLNNVSNGKDINASEISPLIKESIESLRRNDQALLTLLHMHRNDIRLETHAFGVFSLVLPIALKVGCDADDMEALAMAALLHDCGWSRLPINLFSKGKPYDAVEKRLVRQHVSMAVNVLKKGLGIPEKVIKIVEQHHELANGKGYPQGLIHTQLNPLHHIFQIADLYDEYIHGLEDYRGVLPANALKKLYVQSKKGWFPETLVSEVVRILGIYPISSIVKLNTGETAIVTEINRKLPLLPMVTILLDKDDRELEIPEYVDLATDEKRRLIQKVLEPSSIPEHLVL